MRPLAFCARLPFPPLHPPFRMSDLRSHDSLSRSGSSQSFYHLLPLPQSGQVSFLRLAVACSVVWTIWLPPQRSSTLLGQANRLCCTTQSVRWWLSASATLSFSTPLSSPGLCGHQAFFSRHEPLGGSARRVLSTDEMGRVPDKKWLDGLMLARYAVVLALPQVIVSFFDLSLFNLD